MLITNNISDYFIVNVRTGEDAKGLTAFIVENLRVKVRG